MDKLLYAACEGKVSDIKALESSTYWEFCSVLNNFLDKVEKHNAEIEKLKRENNLGSSRSPVRSKPVKSSGRKKK